MFSPVAKGTASEVLPSDFGSVLARIAVALLALITAACAHAMLYHLHYILAPFILSGFLVFALEPSVQRIYTSLAGLAAPYRWCCCCMHRRHRSRRLRAGEDSSATASETSDAESAHSEESQILLGDQVGAEWEKYTIRIMDMACRLLAVIIVLAGVILIAGFLIYMLASGALQIKDKWPAYQKGMQNWVQWLDQMRDVIVARLKISGAIDARARMVYTSVLGKFQEWILELVDSIVTFVTGSVSFAAIVLLYMLFWLFQPLPISGKASQLVQNYIWKKTFVAVVYGTSVGTFLYLLGVDLSIFFGLVSCLLHFVPEVGAFISMLAPVPIILLNGNFERPITVLMVSFLGQVLLKLAIGNLLELKLISEDDEMSIHPVWVLLSLNYFGFLWGPVGMLISVPLLATIKSIAISKEEELKQRQPYLSDFAGTVLACLEGRKRKEERRRSSWLLPFSSAQKGQDDATPTEVTVDAPTVPDMPAPKDDEQDESTPAVALGPKKTRQPEAPRSSPAEAASEMPRAADVEQ